jgi:prepilin-type N-terminal cleavage/methylation domain-containing protein/prepilin-type processing-associated H-X9-DG protein
MEMEMKNTTLNAIWGRRRGGYTLVELLIVIAIISILASMLFPALRKAQEAAYRTTCASNMRTIALQGIMAYADDYRGWTLGRHHATFGKGDYTVAANKTTWMQRLALDSAYPGVGLEYLAYDFKNHPGAPTGVFRCPTETEPVLSVSRKVHIGIHAHLAVPIMQADKWQRDSDHGLFKPYSVKRPSRLALLGDARTESSFGYYISGPWGGKGVSLRHDDGSNFAFVDGHVNRLQSAELPVFDPPTNNAYKEYPWGGW